MSIRNYKDLLEDSWSLEKDLLGLIKQLLIELWGTKGEGLYHLIESDVESYDQHRFIHCLSMLKDELAEREQRIAQYEKMQMEKGIDPTT